MMHRLQLYYVDGYVMTINFPEEEKEKFMQAISQKKFWFRENHKDGFWTDLDKIRYMTLEELPPLTNKDISSEPQKMEKINEMDPGDKEPT